MEKIKIRVTNASAKRTQYHYKSSVGGLDIGVTKDITISVGDTLHFENDKGMKYVMAKNDHGRTFTYNH